jgi:cardiolipin synthase
MLKSKPGAEYKSNNNIRLLTEPGEYFELLEEMLTGARQTIHLQTYIFQDDTTGTWVADLLIDAAKRGIKVYVLVDGYASQSLSDGFVERIRQAGVYFSFFQPILKSKDFYVGRRMHHKMVVVDAEFALIGGINIADRYNKIPNEPCWKNIDLYIHGETAGELEKICCQIWNKNTKRIRVHATEKKIRLTETDETSLLVRRNDWVKSRNEISKSYVDLFKSAKKEIIIICSYFIPGNSFRKLMHDTTQRGVKIQVVVAGKSDVVTAKYAERYWYDWLLRNNIKIYEYQNNVLHAKTAQRDGEWMTVGSYNLNDISAYASLELNIDIKGKEFIEDAREKMEAIIQNDCIEITSTQQWNVLSRFGHWLSFYVFRVAFFLFTFYLRREKE